MVISPPIRVCLSSRGPLALLQILNVYLLVYASLAGLSPIPVSVAYASVNGP